MDATIYDARLCELGEGPLWHPERAQLFWFDILGKRLLSRNGAAALEWTFEHHVSAAGWVSRDRLLIASEVELFVFDLADSTWKHVHPLEADNPVTRSNDGRADPQGGFWIGTMGKAMEPEAGAIYRYAEGRLEKLFDKITVSNSICFSPDGASAYFTDTRTRRIMRVALDAGGWPDGAPEVFVDLNAEELNPDGSVVDAEGGLWNAQWGAARVARYHPDGRFDRAIGVGGKCTSCPAFGGPELSTLFVTTARQDLRRPGDEDGPVYVAEPGVRGLAEHRVVL